MIYEQVDTGKNGFLYSWLLEAPYRLHKQLQPWQWVRGKPGCYRTHDRELAMQTALRLNITIRTNNTHKSLNAPFCLAR